MLLMDLPEQLQQEFEQTAQQLYNHDAMKQAMVEAVELWLAKQRQCQVELEAKANDQAFEKLRDELEQNYFGQWIVIAHGQLQGVGDSLTEVNHFAPNAQDRIVMQVGQHRPKEVVIF